MGPLMAMTLLLALCGQFGQGNRKELEKLVVIFRHGFRYPDIITFRDQCASKYTDDLLGQLTPKGKEQMKHLGQVLRLRYNSFLGDGGKKGKEQMKHLGQVLRLRYNSFLGDGGKIQVQYSVGNRTKDSAYLVAQGLSPKYHRRGPAIFLISERLSGGNSSDPKAGYELFKYIPVTKAYHDLQPTCEKQTHHDCGNYLNMYTFIDQINSEVNDDCQLPDWWTPDNQQNVKSVYQNLYASFKCGLKDKYVTKAADGMLGWIDEMFQGRGSRSEAKGFFMSLHDINIAMVSSRIGIFNGLTIPLGAVLVFELWRLQRGQVVRTFYMNDTTYRNMYQLKIPSCSWDCPINAFVRATKKPYVQCQPAPEARLVKCSATTVS